ncbi:MFS transporter [Microlunatus spumicola]|uniref:MFS transporter n=1 Tax=Microlunatus spumicola TaxID=81499 RepID=A0ABP6WI83_9ACTN
MVQTLAPARASSPKGQRGNHRWLALGVIAIAQLMVVLDATIVNIALPSAQRDLGFTDDSRQWIITAYSLAFGGLLLLGGRIGDLFGRKKIFIVGLAGFAVASVLGGLAPTFATLVGARALQGAFGALLAPAALSLLTTTFTDPKERGRAFGVFGAVAGSGAAVGLLLGGVLTEYTSWRWCLYVNVFFAVVAIIGAALLLPRSQPGGKPTFDIPGILTITLGLVGVVYGFSNAEVNGWGAPVTVASLAVGAVLIVAFVLIEQRVAHPLLPLRIVLDRDRGGAMLALGLSAIGMFGIFLFLTYYLEASLGYSALKTGLAFVAMPLSIIFSSNVIGGPLLPRVGPKILIFVGGMLASIGLLLLTRTELDSSYVGVVLPGLVVIGLGMGLIFSSAISTGTSGVQREDAGVASATVNTMQQIGGSIGTALLSTIYAGSVRGFASDNPTLPDVQAYAVLHGYHVAFTISSAVLFAVALTGGLVVRRRSHRLAAAAARPADQIEAVPVAAH